ncbi:MAG: nucleotide sugar dehydrogenase [Acetobacterales bacterium]
MTPLPERFPDSSVCVVGCGYVGLTLAVTLAACGFRTLGVEVRKDVVTDLREGKAHFHEPGMEAQMRRLLKSGRLSFESAIPEGCDASVYIVTVGTPLGGDGRARLDMVARAAHEVAERLRGGELVVMRSTVKLGTTRDVVVPILDAPGKPYELAFCPERTLEGQALAELRTLPQIVGGLTHQATMRAAQFFQFVTPTIVRVRDLETAEMIKMVDNAQRDVHFAFSNEVARVCDAVGVSAAEVIRAGKLGYQRTNLPMPGPVGGPCLSKDPYILAEGMEGRGPAPEMTLAARRINEAQPAEIAAFLRDRLGRIAGFPEQPTICLAGIAFKGRPATDDLRGTMAKPMLDAMREAFPGACFTGFDAVVAADAVAAFGLQPQPSLEAAFEGADLVVVLNNHPVFAAMQIELLAARLNRPGLVYDLWNNFDAADLELPEGTGYVALGGHGVGRLPDMPAAERRA